MAATDEQWLDTQIARWEHEKQRAETILQHLYGLREALHDSGTTLSNSEPTTNPETASEPKQIDNETRSKVENDTKHTTSNKPSTTRKTKPTKTRRKSSSKTRHKTSDAQVEAKPLARELVHAVLLERGPNTVPRLDILLQERGRKVSRQGIANALEQLRNEGRAAREDATEPGVKYQWRAIGDIPGGLFGPLKRGT